MRAGAVAVLLSLAIWLGGAALRPPAAVPVGAPATEFSAERALAHLWISAREPHPLGSAAHAAVRDYLLRQFTALGVEPQVQTATAVVTRWGPPYAAATVQNVVARLRGSGGGKALLLGGHYDSAPVSPGASDDGHSAAVLLETLRALKAGPPLARDVIFLLTDGEEAGLLGAAAFLEQHPWARDVGLALNFEARGTSGPAYLFETSRGNGALVREFAHAAPRPAATSLSDTAYQYLPNDTDLTLFKEAGAPGLNFAYIGDVVYYHTSLDNVAHLDPPSLQHEGDYALSLARHFGNLNLSALRGGDAGYWYQPPLGLIGYPAAWAFPVALLPVGLFAAIVWAGRRKRYLELRAAALALLGCLAGIATAAAAAALVWYGVRKLHPGYAFLAQGEPYNPAVYRTAFVALAVSVTSAVCFWLKKRYGMANATVAALLLWLALSLATSFALPGVSYLFVWPLLFFLRAVLWGFLRQDRELASPTFWLAAVPGVALLTPVIQLLFVGLTLRFAAVAALVVALLTVLLLPIAGVFRGWLPAGAALASLVCFAAGSFSNGFDREHPRPDSIWYGLDSDAGSAAWFSWDPQPDSWTGRYLGPHPARERLPEYQPFLSREALTAPAALIGVVPPVLELIREETGGGYRTLRLRMRSPRSAPVLFVFADPRLKILAAAVNSRPIEKSKVRLKPAQRALIRPGRRWALRYSALPPGGVELLLKVKAGTPAKLTAMDLSYGIPAQFPRPPDAMPAPFWPDATVVRKSFTF